MGNLSFACTALVGTSKVGLVKPDQDGYYDLILGALDFGNSYGAEYTLASAKEIFKASSGFVRRINNGYCRSEYGHPKKEPGMTDDDYFMRIMRIEETRVCAHIKKVWIDYDSVKTPDGRRVIAIRGLVKPTGPLGPTLEAQLQNPSENVAFSIRSITEDQCIGRKHLKHLREIVTWDYVTEPGLSVANKYQSPGLEDMKVLDEIVMPLELLVQRTSQVAHGISMESSNILRQVIDSVSLEHQITPGGKKPLSAKW